MKKLYKVAENLAKKSLKQYGVEITFTQTSEASIDLTLGQRVGASVLTFTGFGVKSTYSKSEIDGSLIQAGDVKLLLETMDEIPKVGDEAAVNGSGSFRVMSIDLISPAEETIVYELQLRK